MIGIIGLIPQVDTWLPSNLVGSFDTLIAGGEFAYWRSLLTTIILSTGSIGSESRSDGTSGDVIPDRSRRIA